MIDKKLISLLEGLIKRTNEGLLKWEETASENIFQVSFPSQSIEIARMYWSESEWHSLSVFNREGKLLEQLNGDDIKNIESNSDTPDKLEELFELARRTALNTEEEIDSLLKTLDDDKLLSSLSSKKTSPPPPPNIDDIPF